VTDLVIGAKESMLLSSDVFSLPARQVDSLVPAVSISSDAVAVDGDRIGAPLANAGDIGTAYVLEQQCGGLNVGPTRGFRRLVIGLLLRWENLVSVSM
jgi:hypothetical protein